MKIFISWSGKQSQAVANALREWLPAVIPGSQPWVTGQLAKHLPDLETALTTVPKTETDPQRREPNAMIEETLEIVREIQARTAWSMVPNYLNGPIFLSSGPTGGSTLPMNLVGGTVLQANTPLVARVPIGGVFSNQVLPAGQYTIVAPIVPPDAARTPETEKQSDG